ncbi:MAG TPA: adenylate/guanylate cyclase domain-containing protein [Solirubrobacterales bacterium]|nr:adenylate/guanylate cyclase domain-containing protein [Solirubrobacterales bacterium]
MPALSSRPLLDRLVNHPWLIGDPTTPGRKLGNRVSWLTLIAIVAANAIGALVVIGFAVLALPKPDGLEREETIAANLVLAAAYLTFAIVLGARWGRRLVEGGRGGIRSWLDSDRPPDEAEKLRVLRAPLRILGVAAALWAVAVAGFALLNLLFDPLLALGVGLTVALGGVTTCAVAYLLTELALRPVASRALASGAPHRRRLPGLTARWLFAWALGTGAPIVGLALIGVVALTPVEMTEATLAVTTVTLCGIALAFGALTSLLAVYATVHPIGSIRRGLAEVQEGNFDVELAVWDSTEIGLLQAGFNEMVAGLREREQIRDLFGRQVGREVAREALATGVDLGGVECEVAVVFVDVVGSTRLAATRSPHEVVNLLNRFFGGVVEVIEAHGGWINKFEGDAALAVFGAPRPLHDAHGRALAAARELDRWLRASVAEVEAGIGVGSGTVVAGHVGHEHRFEYTVIGDPVNEAARLADLAKEDVPHVLASARTVRLAGEPEAASWREGEAVELRGRSAATVLAHPIAASD